MEGLPSAFGEWDLESDKKLLACLQRFSAGFLSRVSEAEDSLDHLLRDTKTAEIRANDVGNRFRLLAHTHFIEQVGMGFAFGPPNATCRCLPSEARGENPRMRTRLVRCFG